jgi:hypothetical protein
MWCLILPMEWRTTSTQADIPQFLYKFEIAKANFFSQTFGIHGYCQRHHGHPLCTWFPERMGLGGLKVITIASIS